MGKFRTAEIIVIGSEFFSRDKLDTNSIWITEKLEQIGVRVLSKSIVSDDLDALTRVMKQGLETSDLVISTGGLGPTEDDRTRLAASLALGRDLIFREELLEQLKARFVKRGRTMSENNRRQAYVPEDSEPVENPNGTAPGFSCLTDASLATFLALPGPPREMKPMFEAFLDSHRDKLPDDQLVTARRTLRVAGLGESAMDGLICDLYQDLTNPELTINFTGNDIEIHLTAKAANIQAAEGLLTPLVEAIKERLRGFLFSEHDKSLAEVVVGLLATQGFTLAIAESITGGNLAHQICSVPGASSVFLGSVVAYTEGLKSSFLGVDSSTLKKCSDVSAEVAREMVEGLKQKTGATLVMSCTGYAGPSGGTTADPVGTVYVGFSTPTETKVSRLSLTGGRNLVRTRTSQAMLFQLFQFLQGEYH